MQPCLRSLFELMWSDPMIKKYLIITCNNKFRSKTDVIPMELMRFIGVKLNKMQLKIFNDQIYIGMKSISSFLKKIKLLFLKKPKLFCINNELLSENKNLDKLLREKLTQYYGVKLL